MQALGFWWTCRQRARAGEASAEPARGRRRLHPRLQGAAGDRRPDGGRRRRPAGRGGEGLGAGRRQRRRHARPRRPLRRGLHPAPAAHRREGGQHQPCPDRDLRPVHRRLRLGPRGGPRLPRGHPRAHGGPQDRVRSDAAVLRQHRAPIASRRRPGRSRHCSSGPSARGKDGLGAVFCCGTNVLFRREAFESVGGFPTNSLTEDFELSIVLHERGWRSAYVPDVLARGLGPEDTAAYVSQQQRWARGCLSGLPRALRARLPLAPEGAVPALGPVLPVRGGPSSST